MKPASPDMKSFIPYYPRKMESQNQKEAHTAKAFVISCMDFRLLDDIVLFLNDKGYHNNYDQFIIAGSSLGFNQEKHPSWRQSCEMHLDIAKQLHQVREIICIDHLACGAYRMLYPWLNLEEEREYHIKNLKRFEITMKEKYPEMKISLYIMDLDGDCEQIPTDGEVLEPKTVKKSKFSKRRRPKKTNKVKGNTGKATLEEALHSSTTNTPSRVRRQRKVMMGLSGGAKLRNGKIVGKSARRRLKMKTSIGLSGHEDLE